VGNVDELPRKKALRLVSIFTFPFIRSIRIEFYFLCSRRYRAWSSAHSEARETRRPSHWASRAIDNSTRPFAVYTEPKRQRHYGNGATERQRGHGLYGNGYGNGYGWTETYRWKPGVSR